METQETLDDLTPVEPNFQSVPDIPDLTGLQPVTIFSPTGPLPLGINTDLNAASLTDGTFRTLQNLKPVNNDLTVREGISLLTDGSGSESDGAKKLSTWIGLLQDGALEASWVDIYRGSAFDPGTGVFYLALADKRGATDHTRVFWYSPSRTLWLEKTNEVTTPSVYDQPYGDTAFEGSDKWVSFALVSDKHYYETLGFAGNTEYSYILAMYGDGKQWPLVAPSVDDQSLYSFAQHRPVKAPDQARAWYQATFAYWWSLAGTITDSASHGSSNDGQRWDWSFDSTSKAIHISIYSNVTSTNWVQFRWTGAASGRNLKKIDPTTDVAGIADTSFEADYIVLSIRRTNDWGAYDLWTQLKLELAYGATTVDTLYDGQNVGVYQEPIIVQFLDSPERYLVAFAIDKYLLTHASSGYDGIRLTISGSAPTSTITFDIEAVAFTSGLPGFTTFGFSHFNSQSRAESAFVVAAYREPAKISEIGGASVEVRIPESNALNYNFRAYSAHPDITALPAGTEYLLTYAKLPSGTYGLLSGNHQRIAVLSTGGSPDSWVDPTGLSDPEPYGSPTTGATRCREIRNEVVLPRPAPTAFTQTLPPGTSCTIANNRVVVGQANMFRPTGYETDPLASGQPNLPGYAAAVSSALCPWHFEPIVRFADGQIDPLSPTVVQINGEKVVGLYTFSTGESGGDSVMMFTSQGVWIVSGMDAYQISRPTKISTHGCLSPKAIAGTIGQVFWLDSSMQIRGYGAQNGILSYNQINGDLAAIPTGRAYWTSMAYRRDTLWLSYTPAGGTSNTQMYVIRTMDPSARGFWTWKSSKADVAGFTIVLGLSGSEVVGPDMLIGCDKRGRIYWLEDPTATNDAGTAITAKWRSKSLNYGYGAQLSIHQARFLLDGQAQNATASSYINGDTVATDSSTFSVAVDSGRTTAYVTTTLAGTMGEEVALEFQANLNAGTRLMGAWATLETKVYEGRGV